MPKIRLSAALQVCDAFMALILSLTAAAPPSRQR
jgi:hypothetical protein